MNTFNEQKELLTFLFAGEDYYLTDSLVRLDLRDYLHFKLRQNGYSCIIYVKCFGTEADVEILDEISYNEYKAFLGYGARKISESGKSYTLNYGLSDLAGYLKKRLDKQKNMAVVFRGLSDFTRLVSAGAELRQQICDRGKDIRDKNHNLILLLCGVKASDSREWLVRSDSVLQQYPALSPALSKVFSRQTDLYKAMADQMGSQCLFWNDLKTEDIQKEVDVCLLFESEDSFSRQERDDLIAVIDTWYHSPSFREAYKSLLSEDPLKSRDYLHAVLTRRLTALRASIAQLHEALAVEGPLKTELSLMYPSLKESVIFVDLGPVVTLRKMRQSMEDQSMEIDHTRLQMLIRDYSVIYSEGISSHMRALTHTAAEKAEQAYKRGDIVTYHRALSLLSLCASEKLVFKENNREDWKLWETLLEESEKLFGMGRLIREREGKIQRERKRCDDARAEVRRLRSLGHEPETSPRLQMELKTAVAAKKQIDNLNHLNMMLIEEQDVYASELNMMEQYAENFMYYEEETRKNHHEKAEKAMEALLGRSQAGLTAAAQMKSDLDAGLGQLGAMGSNQISDELMAEYKAIEMQQL